MTYNIYLVDDDEEDRFIFGEALAMSGIKAAFKEFQDGEYFEQYLEATTVIPDLVLLDMNMPRRNGFAVLEGLKEDPKYKDIPVLMYTTSRSREDVEAAKQRRASGFITKPTDFNDLETIIKKVVHNFYGATEPSAFLKL